MKYLYYILAILIVITIGIALQLSRLKIQISEPAVVINDRIISQKELDERMKTGSYQGHEKGFLESMVTRELLIQEAVKLGINKEEAFRKSVENFYEQSLVKILIDRKFQSISPKITDEMIERYTTFSGKTLCMTKFLYRNNEDFENNTPQSTTEFENDFENMSDALKFSLLPLKPGEFSSPEQTGAGIVVYRIDRILTPANAHPMTDAKQIREFLTNQFKKKQFDSWMAQLRAKAHVQILTKNKL
jgi:hypothetical protein